MRLKCTQHLAEGGQFPQEQSILTDPLAQGDPNTVFSY